MQRKIEKTALRLKKKFSAKRKVNEEKLLKPKSTFRKVVSVVVDVLLVGICIICCLFGVGSFLFKMNHIPPTFAGYSFMQISSGSMVADGFNVGDAIVVKRIDAKTLNIGDNIAFYVYPTDYKKFNKTTSTLVEKENTEHNYSVSFAQFFGVPTEEMSAAAKSNSRLVFHKITKIYQDKDGMYWFQTKGSSNPLEDYWQVSEKMVIGVEDNSAGAKFFSGILQLLATNMGLIIVLGLPILILSVMFVLKSIKRVQLARLELDCIEEKRKITDAICVRNNIGFNMSKKDKYKILAQAKEGEREQYLSLLWKDGSAPNSIKKYVIRKHFTIKPIEKRLELNRACEKMHADGVSHEKIAKYYLIEQDKIEKEQQRYKKIFKSLRKKAQQARETEKNEEVKQQDNIIVMPLPIEKTEPTKVEVPKEVQEEAIVSQPSADIAFENNPSEKKEKAKSVKTAKPKVESKGTSSKEGKTVAKKASTVKAKKEETKTATKKATLSKEETKVGKTKEVKKQASSPVTKEKKTKATTSKVKTDKVDKTEKKETTKGAKTPVKTTKKSTQTVQKSSAKVARPKTEKTDSEKLTKTAKKTTSAKATAVKSKTTKKVTTKAKA